MQGLKRVLAAITIGISVVMLVLSLAGIAGCWMANAQISGSIVDVLTVADTRLETVDKGLDKADAALTRARATTAAVEKSAESLGADVEQNKPVVTVISNTVGAELAPLVHTTRETVRTVREAVVAVNSTIEALNAMPFVSVPTPELTTLQKLSDDLESLEAMVKELRATIDRRRSEIVQGTVSVVTGPTTQIDSALERAQATVAQYSQRVKSIRAALAAARSEVPVWLNVAAVVITVVLLWVAFSQVGLLVHGWRFFSGRDLLAH